MLLYQRSGEHGQEMAAGAIHLGGDFGDGVEDWNAAGRRMHKDLDRAGETQRLQFPHQRAEVKRTAAWHLQQFVFLGQFFC